MNKTHKVRIPLRVWLLYLLVLSFVATGVTFSRFITTSEGEDSARVAKFSFYADEEIVSGSDKIVDLSKITQPGDSKTITLKVSNKNENGVVSEVKEQYIINLVHIGSLPLSYIIDGVVVYDAATAGSDTYTINGIFEPSLEEAHTYTIKIEWPEDKKDSKYSSGSGMSSLNVSMIGEQIQ